jgi:hypothetical protein
VASGASIVVLAIAVFLVVTAGTAVLRRGRAASAARDSGRSDSGPDSGPDGLDGENVMADA